MNQTQDLSNQVIVITGGTGKVGRQLVGYFLAEGATLIVASRSQKKLDQLAKNLGTTQAKRLVGVTIDLAAESSAQTLISSLTQKKLQPTVLVNAARDLEHLQTVDNRVPRHSWVGGFVLDVVVPYELAVAFADQPDSKLQTVINISSMYGVVAVNPNLYPPGITPVPPNYGVSKAATIHLTKELAVRLRGSNIAVNAISYGGVAGRAPEALKKRYHQLCPLGRMLHDQEVIGPAAFLVSANSAGMTGHNLVVDGGWTIW